MAGQASKDNGKKGGRPPGSVGGHTIEAAKAREYLVTRIADELGPIVDTHIELAKAGDAKALQYLMDQVAGKAKESVDLKVTDTSVDLTPLDPKMAEEKKKLLEQYHQGLKQIIAKSRKKQ